MKKLRIFTLILAFVMVFSLAACGENKDDSDAGKDRDNTESNQEPDAADPQDELADYDTGAGLKLKMAEGMTKDTYEAATAVYTSENYTMSALKETFDEAAEMGYETENFAVEEYTALMAETYTEIDAFGEDSYGNNYAAYVKDTSDGDFFYFCTVRKATDAVWIVNFMCLESDRDTYQPLFELWSSTIEVE